MGEKHPNLNASKIFHFKRTKKERKIGRDFKNLIPRNYAVCQKGLEIVSYILIDLNRKR